MKQLILLVALILATLPARAAVPAPAVENKALPAAVEAWVSLLEKDQATEAAKTCVADEKAAEQMTRYWKNLKGAHAKHDYRKWLEQAATTPDDQSFTIGGHSYAHMHVVWSKTDKGWRITNVFMCR